jgi:hypothetical protein
MKTFISHSFDDDARFDDLCYSLSNRDVSFWNPTDLRGGASLREQLRKAIDTCDCCIFIATKNSLKSNWCSAELGAFWGAGKKVIVYVADDALTNEDLPEQFKGDIWFRKIRDVVNEAKETLAEMAENRQPLNGEKNSSPRVSEISVGALLELIRSVVGREGEKETTLSTKMDKLFSVISVRIEDADIIDSDITAILGPRIEALIGEPIVGVESYRKGVWPFGFSVVSSTGRWTGYACKFMLAGGGDVEIYTGCLLLHFRDGYVDAVIVVPRVVEIGIERPTRYSNVPPVAYVGVGDVGTISSMGEFSISDSSG